MKTLLNIDRFDGTVEPRNQKEILDQVIFDCAKAMKPKVLFVDKDEDDVVCCEFDNREWVEYIYSKHPNYAHALIGPLQEDEILRKFCLNLFLHRENNGGYYVFNKGLVDCLSEVSVNITTDKLKDFHGYIEMPNVFDKDGDEIDFIYVAVHQVENVRRISAHGYLKEGQCFGANVHLTDGANLEEAIAVTKHNMYVETKVVNEELVTSRSNENDIGIDSKNWFRTLVNCLLYMQDSEELVVEKNVFATKKKKAQTQKKIYTQKPYIMVGKNFTRSVLMSETEFGVRGHLRWQPFGEGRRNVKLTFVKPHKRTRKTIEEELTNPLEGK